jgi:hypothetical protein
MLGNSHFLLFLCVYLLRLCLGFSSEKYIDYLAKCKIEQTTWRPQINELCHVALFSDWSFNAVGDFYIVDNDLCEPVLPSHIAETLKTKSTILGVRKGVCSFEEKTRNAELFGAAGLVLINNGPSFPVGLSNADFTSKIPVVMIQASEKYDDHFGQVGSIHLQYGETLHLYSLNNTN